MNQENNLANVSKCQSQNEYYKNWLMNNPEKIKTARKVWYESNKDNQEYKQKRKEYNKQYYLKKKTAKTDN